MPTLFELRKLKRRSVLLQTHLTFGAEFTTAVEAKQVAQQEAEKQRFVVEKVTRLLTFFSLHERSVRRPNKLVKRTLSLLKVMPVLLN